VATKKELKMNALERHFKKQTTIAWFVTLTLIALPLIRYNGTHLLLFNFYHGRFEFLFHAWEVSTGYLTAIFILSAIGVILIFNFTYSRYFCGQFCPKTLLKRLFTDFIQAKMLRIARVRDRQKEEKIASNLFKMALSYVMLLLICIVSAWVFSLYLMPADVLVEMTGKGFSGHPFVGYILAAIGLYLFAEALYFKEFFCSYLCPYQLVNSVTVSEERSAYTFHDAQKCTECDACVRICPVPGLDIKKGFDTRCIACGDCAEVCAEVMEKQGSRESLISYRTLAGVPNRHRFFSFAKPAVSLTLAIFTALAVGMLTAYLVSVENLDYCRFINAHLYK
jgi:polyferredoxin